MVEQSQSTASKLYNNRYKKVKEIGQGSFANVYLCHDLFPQEKGRFICDEYLRMLKLVEEESPEYEFVSAGYYGDAAAASDPAAEAEKKAAIEVLQDFSKLFPDNDRYAAREPAAAEERLVAVKKSKMNAFNDRDGVQFYALREIQILQELRDSANICQLLDVFFSEKDQSICLVLEYIPTSLDSLLAPKVKAAPKSESDEEEPAIVEPLSNEKIEEYMEQVLSGIIQMHSKHIMHRDIKADNLLVKQADGGDRIKFIDFGISKQFEGDRSHLHTKNVVTRCYRPPEIFFGARSYTGQEVDMWSAGCVFAEMLTGSILFHGQSDIEQLSLIFAVLGTPTLDDWPEVEQLPCYLPFEDQKPQDLATVLQEAKTKNYKADHGPIKDSFVAALSQMLRLNPGKRISPAEALKLLKS